MTQIQEKSIPAILDGKDCFVKSQTGSGKTLAYAVPVVQRLQERNPRIKRSEGIFALVLVPTREVNKKKLCKKYNFSIHKFSYIFQFS